MAEPVREFTIQSMPSQLFREAYASPVELLALGTQVNFDSFQKTKEIFTFSLEHIEVRVGEQWFPVKQPGREVYAPPGIEKNFRVLNDLCTWYMNEVIGEVFTDSAE